MFICVYWKKELIRKNLLVTEEGNKPKYFNDVFSIEYLISI